MLRGDVFAQTKSVSDLSETSADAINSASRR